MSTAPAAQPLILIAEDHPDHAYFMTEALAENGLTRVHHVADGTECLQFLGLETGPPAPSAPALLLLDIRMPGADGYAVLEEIRKSPAHAALPVVVLSTSAEHEDVQRMQHLGADGYLRKPVGYTEYLDLAARLRRWWQQQGPLPSEQF